MSQSTLSRRDIFRVGAIGLAGRLVGRAAEPTLLRRPYLQNIQERRATILWATHDAGEGTVLVTSPDGSSFPVSAVRRELAPSVTRLPFSFYQYQADVMGLAPSTAYAYQIALDGQVLTPAAPVFQTAGPGNFSFIVFGDSGQRTREQIGLVGQMRREAGASFVVHTGDLAYPEGDFRTYESNYFGLNAPLMESLPFYATPGNHDYLADAAYPFVACHAKPESNVHHHDAGRYYSFDWGDAHFASLDSNLLESDRASRMTEWLIRDLRSTGKFWKVLIVHHTPYPTGHHLHDGLCEKVRDRIAPIVESGGVQLVLAGHEHGYERTLALREGRPAAAGQGTMYVTSGGGGANLHRMAMTSQTAVARSTHSYQRVEVEDGSLRIRAIGLDGREFDQVVLEPHPVLLPGGIVDAADYSPKLTAGRAASIFGQNLGLRPAISPEGVMELSGTRVRLGEWELPVLYSSPSQLNVQIPPGASGVLPLRVFTANGSAAAEVVVG